MKIYLGHSRAYDYEQELYSPIRSDSELNQVILPHESGNNTSNPKSFYAGLDLFIAEVSYPATGLGIELGWASDADVSIICISKTGTKVSGSLKSVTDKFYTYDNSAELIALIKKLIKNN